MVSGIAAQAWTLHQEIFRIAYEIARAAHATVPDYHRRLFSNWN
jgi:hypothetical protein